MVRLILFGIMLLLWSIISFPIYKKIWNPVIIFGALMFCGCFMALVSAENGTAIIENGIAWLFVGSFLFLATFVSMQYLKVMASKKTVVLYGEKINVDKLFYKSEYNNVEVKTYNKKNLHLFMKACFVFAIVSVLLAFREVMKCAESWTEIFTNTYSLRVRYLQRTSSTIFSLFSVFVSINFYVLFALFPIYFKNGVKNVKTFFVLIVAIRLAQSFITMSKELFILDCVFFISVYVHSLFSLKAEYNFFIKYGLIVVVVLGVFIGIIANQRGYVKNGMYDNSFYAIIGTIKEYVGVSIESFSLLIKTYGAQMGGAMCFRAFYSVGEYLGLTESVPIFQEKVGDANVFSIFGNMYNDLGFGGIISLSLLFGALFGSLYTIGNTNKLSKVVCNSIILVTMFFAYYDLKLIQTIYIFIIIYAFVFEYVFFEKLYIAKREKRFRLLGKRGVKKDG